VIKKEKNGYRVYSHDGSKPLSKILKSHDEAVKRLKQIEYYKEKNK
jgi:hypothetical protein